MVDIAPLQLYASALVFAPEQSFVKTTFKNCMPRWLIRPPEVDKTWNNEVFILEGHTEDVSAIEFSPNDHFLATCSKDGTVRVWDTTAMACFRCFHKAGHAPYSAAFSTDSKLVAIAYVASTDFRKGGYVIATVVCEIAGGKVLRKLDHIITRDAIEDGGMALAFSNDMSIFVGAISNNTIQAWRAADGESTAFERLWVHELHNQEETRLGLYHNASITICRVAPQLAYYHPYGVVGSHSLTVLDLLTGSVVNTQLGDGINGGIQYHGKDLATFKGMGSNVILGLLNIHTGDFQNLSRWNPVCNFALAHSRDKLAVSSSFSQIVEVQSLLTTQEERKTYQREVYHLAVSANGKAIAVRYSDSLSVLNPEGKTVAQRSRPFLYTAFGRSYIAISPDGTLFADLDYNSNLWILDMNSSCEGELEANIARAFDIDEFAFSRDNKQVAIEDHGILSVCDLEHDQERSSILVSLRNDWDDPSSSHCPFRITSGILSPKDHALDLDFKDGVGFEELQFIYSEPEWIQYNKRDLLWIPKRYRTTGNACGAGGNLVALAYEDGSVRIMKFADHITL